MIIWITGLSGAGKSTLASELVLRLRNMGKSTVLLDGDELRMLFVPSAPKDLSHGREMRLALALQYAELCRMLAKQELTVVIATISMFKEIQKWNRVNLPGYFEVFLKVPIDELRRRDPKEIYRRFDAGELTDVAGLDLFVDEPVEADWIEEFTTGRNVSVMADELMYQLFGSRTI